MNNRNLVFADAIVNYVWITPEPQRTDVKFFDQSMAVRKGLKPVDSFFNVSFTSCAARGFR